ncbi:hypothetical protein [uncultured Aquimarina sp.]|uniref:hypothetical protein n=1 Tax=uncultured Aquimarina sp. TaxID=575652 RepID=UPI00263A0CCF|nr:hypothetical protein [uncultured Aquimarina sp.]
MKKITLLLVAAVFAIGIQSCSTDEIGIEEETLQENPAMKRSDIISNGLCPDCIIVLFPNQTPENQRNKFRNLMKSIIFESILIDHTKSCGIKETWIVVLKDGMTLNDIVTGGLKLSGGEELVVTANKQDDDDPDHPNTPKFRATWVSELPGCF